MSSLKAGSIFRKRIKILLLLLVVTLPLHSAEFRVGIYSNDENALSLLEEAISSIGGQADSNYSLEKVKKRLALESERNYLKALNEAYQKESGDSVPRIDAEDVSLPLNISTLYLKPADKEQDYLLSGDSDAFRYFLLKENLDLILVLKSEKSDGIPLLTLYADGEIIRESLYLNNLLDEERRALLSVIVPYFRDDSVRIYRLTYPRASAISIDGVKADLLTDFVVLKPGMHRFSISAPYYIPADIELELADEEDVVLSMEKDTPNLLFLSPIPYDAKLNYQGNELSSHLVRDSISPFSLTASYSGFSLYSFESTRALSSLSLSLKPEWMSGENILEKEKGKFYASLFTTLISFGASVGAGTIQRIYSEYDFGPFDVVFTGVSLVSLIWMADSMFSYFDAARYGL